ARGAGCKGAGVAQPRPRPGERAADGATVPAAAADVRRCDRRRCRLFRETRTTIQGKLSMATARKVIISCAVTGSIHTPTMTPYLPITPAEVAAGGIGAAEAGAAILHLHARDPKDGRPTPDPKVFMQFLPQIKAATDAVINITTGGGHNMTVQERLAAPLLAKPEGCSLNMGSMNFGLFPALEKRREWKHGWEPQYLEATRDFIFKNTFKDIEYSLKHLGEDCGTRFEFECYDVGHLYNLAH